MLQQGSWSCLPERGWRHDSWENLILRNPPLMKIVLLTLQSIHFIMEPIIIDSGGHDWVILFLQLINNSFKRWTPFNVQPDLLVYYIIKHDLQYAILLSRFVTPYPCIMQFLITGSSSGNNKLSEHADEIKCKMAKRRNVEGMIRDGDAADRQRSGTGQEDAQTQQSCAVVHWASQQSVT